MKLFQQQDDQGTARRARTSKLLRRMKHKRERKAARSNPEHAANYNRYCGWVLSLTVFLLLSGCSSWPQPSAVKLSETYDRTNDIYGMSQEISFPLPEHFSK